MKKSFKKLTAFVVAIVMVLAIAALAACAGKTQLATPVIKLDGNKVSWQAVEHADSYDVTVGNKAAVNVKTTEYTVTETTPGDYAITVVAKSSDEKYTDSKPSNSITYRVSAPPADTLTVQAKAEYVVVDYDNGWTVDFSHYDFSNLIEAKFGETAITYDQLTVTAAGTTCGEKALTVTVEYGDDESEQVQFDVYYGIADINQFKAIANKLDGWYIVTQEIEGEEITPFGTFTGHLNGNYKKISITGIGGESGWDYGLFNSNEGLIENVHLEAGQVYASGRVAALAGNNKGTIQNCYIKFGFVGGGNLTAGITWGADESEASTGTIIGCVFVGEVYAETESDVYISHAGIVGVSGTGGTKDCLYIVTPCPNTQARGHEAHGTEPADTVAVGTPGANDSNNAAIDYDKLVFSSDGSQYWSSDSEATKYENNLTEQVTALVKEYLQQLTAA